MNQSASTKNIYTALTQAQAEMPAVKMNSQNPFLKNKYADLGAVIETSRPILAKYNLAVVQIPVSDGDKIGVNTMLIHNSGEYIEDTIFLPVTDSKGLSPAQGAGVVISYLRRYSWSAMLGLYADEDTDGGHTGTQPKTLHVESAQPAAMKVPAPKTKAEILDGDWTAFVALQGKAKELNVNIPEYTREKMDAQTVAGASKWIASQIVKKEAK